MARCKRNRKITDAGNDSHGITLEESRGTVHRRFERGYKSGKYRSSSNGDT